MSEMRSRWGRGSKLPLYIYIPFFFFGGDKSSLLHGLSLVVVSRSYSLAVVLRLLIAVASLLWLWRTGSRAQAQQSWCTSFVAPRRVGSSQTRDQTDIPCIGGQILNYWTARKVPSTTHTLVNAANVK